MKSENYWNGYCIVNKLDGEGQRTESLKLGFQGFIQLLIIMICRP